jgi:putative ABC transport system permease protein
MIMLSIIIKEIVHRKLNFIFGAVAVTMAVALVVSFFTMSSASNRETIRLTRDMGFNLRIIPKETDMNDFWTNGYSGITMPENYVLKFNQFKDFSYAHLATTLHERITWQGKDVILTGLTLKEVEPSGRAKSPMIFTIEKGTVQIGYEVAKAFKIKKGETIHLLDEQFFVAKVLPENGSDDDIRIFMQLPDAQQVLNKKGQINEIKALNCLCLSDPDANPLDILRDQLEKVLPQAKVVLNKTIAMARERQRIMVVNYFSFILPIVIFVCAAWIGMLAMLNVKDRKQEIGVLRALGYGADKVAVLFLGRAILIGVIGAIVGFVIGTLLSLKYGPEIFRITAKSIRPIYNLLILSLLCAPVFAAISSFIPAIIAVTQDPALTLRDE